MNRLIVLLSVTVVSGGFALGACSMASPPPKLDTAALPSATTSASVLYITTQPAPVQAPSASVTVPPAGSASAASH